MDRARKWLLLVSYCIVGFAVVLSVTFHTLKLIDLTFFASLIGSFLGLFQIIQAFHIYWKQSISDEEVKAIVHILNISGAKEIVRLLCDHGSLSLKTMHNNFRGSKTTLSNALFALEDKRIITTKPYFDTAEYVRMYRLNPRFKRIVERFRPTFG